MITLRNTTKTAIQAALAITIAESISLYFQLERGYWISLTAMALIAQTWKESVKRSFERVGMTILGGFLGTILYFLLPNAQPICLFALLLFFVFFAVYMLKIYHLISVFFLTCFVVFLFALLGNWNFNMLKLRIIDTLLGASIALMVGFVIFPIKTNLIQMLSEYLKKMKALCTTIFQNKTVQHRFSPELLLVDVQKIKNDALTIRYELLFHELNTQDFYKVVNAIAASTQYLIYLWEGYEWLSPHLTLSEHQLIRNAASTSEHNIQVLIEQIQNNTPLQMIPAENVEELLRMAIAEEPTRFAALESDALGFYSLLYFFAHLNVALNRVSQVLSSSLQR